MDINTFAYIWEQGIVKSAQDVWEGIRPDLREKYSVKIDVSDSMCQKLYAQYEELRLSVRKKYFDTGQEDRNRIDGHKICACITGALLKVRIIDYEGFTKESQEEVPIKIVYANYEIAFLAGIYVMYLFLLSDFCNEGKMDCYEKLKNQATFVFPETNPGHDAYVQGRIKTLALNDLYGNDFDILTYADMLFWIEKYNKEMIYRDNVDAV